MEARLQIARLINTYTIGKHNNCFFMIEFHRFKHEYGVMEFEFSRKPNRRTDIRSHVLALWRPCSWCRILFKQLKILIYFKNSVQIWKNKMPNYTNITTKFYTSPQQEWQDSNSFNYKKILGWQKWAYSVRLSLSNHSEIFWNQLLSLGGNRANSCSNWLLENRNIFLDKWKCQKLSDINRTNRPGHNLTE